MLRYTLARLALIVPILWAVGTAVFVTLSLVPGKSAIALLGPYATPERVANLERELGIDQSLPVRYVRWISGVVRGDWGHAFSVDRPVTSIVFERAGPSLLLAATAFALACVLGLLAGSIAARYRGKLVDRLLSSISFVSVSVPAFWLAMLAILLLSVLAGWFPASGLTSPPDVRHAGSLLDRLHHLLLPALTLAAVPVGIVFRLTRVQLLDTLAQDFVRTARAKGLSESEAAYRHGFRAAVGSVMPVLGLQAGFVIGGAVYIETLFQWPGLGKLLVDSILARDLMLTQGVVLILATAYVLTSLVADLAQRALDPRAEA